MQLLAPVSAAAALQTADGLSRLGSQSTPTVLMAVQNRWRAQSLGGRDAKGLALALLDRDSLKIRECSRLVGIVEITAGKHELLCDEAPSQNWRS